MFRGEVAVFATRPGSIPQLPWKASSRMYASVMYASSTMAWCMNQNTIAANRVISTSTAASWDRFLLAVRPPSDMLLIATTEPPAFVSAVTRLSQTGALDDGAATRSRIGDLAAASALRRTQKATRLALMAFISRRG